MKRKRVSYADEVQVKTEIWDRNSDTTSPPESNHSTITSPTAKRKALNFDDVNMTTTNGNEEEEFYYWLIRKPKAIPLSDLSSLKFPKKVPQQNEKKERTWESDPVIKDQEDSNQYTETLHAEFERVGKPLYHVKHRQFEQFDEISHSDEEFLELDNSIATSSTVIEGMVTISRQSKIVNDFPLLPEEDFLNPNVEESEIPKLPRKLKSIRKRTMVDYEILPQRLKAYGAKPDSNPKKLKKNIKYDMDE